MIMVSACLLGVKCRFDGKDKLNKRVTEYLSDKEFTAVCPECLSDLKTPRCPAEISGGDGKDVLSGVARVINKEGEDVTSSYLMGAQSVLEKAMSLKPELIIFKEKSPSCGVNRIYDGSFSGKLIDGEGVCTALLRLSGFNVISEEDING